MRGLMITNKCYMYREIRSGEFPSLNCGYEAGGISGPPSAPRPGAAARQCDDGAG